MPDIQQTLLDFDATVKAKPNLSDAELMAKFPEFNNDPKLLQSAHDYSATLNSGKYDSHLEMNAKFPEFFSMPTPGGIPIPKQNINDSDITNLSDRKVKITVPKLNDKVQPLANDAIEEVPKYVESADNTVIQKPVPKKKGFEFTMPKIPGSQSEFESQLPETQKTAIENLNKNVPPVAVEPNKDMLNAENAYKTAQGLTDKQFSDLKSQEKTVTDAQLQGNNYNFDQPQEKEILKPDAQSQINNLPITDRLHDDAKKNPYIDIEHPLQDKSSVDGYVASLVPTLFSGAYGAIGKTVGAVRNLPVMLGQAIGLNVHNNPSDFERDMAKLSQHLDQVADNTSGLESGKTVEYFKQGNYLKGIANIGSSIVKMMPEIIASESLGGVGYFAALGASEKFDTLRDNTKVGDQTKSINSIATGALSGMTMYFALDKMPKLVPQLGKWVEQYGEAEAKGMLSRLFYTGTAKVLKHSGVFVEPVAMAIQGMADKVSTNMIDYATGVSQDSNFTKGGAQAFWDGLAMGVGFKTMHTAKALKAKSDFTKAEDNLKNMLLSEGFDNEGMNYIVTNLRGLDPNYRHDALNTILNGMPLVQKDPNFRANYAIKTFSDYFNALDKAEQLTTGLKYDIQDERQLTKNLRNEETEKAKELIRQYVQQGINPDTQSLVFADTKLGNGKIAQGKISFNPDGNINYAKSDNSFVFEDSNGDQHQISIDDIFKVTDNTPADEAMQEAQIKQQREQEITQLQQQVNNQTNQQINPDTNAYQTVLIHGQNQTLAGGRLVYNEDGTIDNQNSDQTLYYYEQDANGNQVINQDGKPSTIPFALSDIDSAGENIPADVYRQQAIDSAMQQLQVKYANEDVEPYTNGDFVRLTDGTYGTIIGKTDNGYELATDNGTTKVIKPIDIIPENQIKGVESGDTVDYIDENGNQQSGVIQIDPTLRKEGKVFIDDVEIPIENILPVDNTQSAVGNQALTPEGEQETAVSGEKQAASSKPAYPTLEDGTPDVKNMTEQQVYDYIKETEGEEEALRNTNEIIHVTQKKISENINALREHQTKTFKLLAKAETMQDKLAIKLKQNKLKAELEAQRTELDDKLKRLRSLIAVSSEQQAVSEEPVNSDQSTVNSEQNIEVSGEQQAVSSEQQPVNSEDTRSQAEKDTEELDAYIAEQEHNTNPTEKQKETGIYDKARVSLQGHNITIETLKGENRTGTDKNGSEWSVTMHNHYGELDGTIGYDGDPIDVFIGPNPKQGQIFVVDQMTPTNPSASPLPLKQGESQEFDESKVMLGFDSAEEAKAAYLSNYEPGWSGYGSITPAGDNFKQWLYDGKKQRKPYAEYKDTPNPVDSEQSAVSSENTVGSRKSTVGSKKQVSPFHKRIQRLGDYVSLEDYILRTIADGTKFVWETGDNNKGVVEELGLMNNKTEKDMRKGILSADGITPQELAHDIWQNHVLSGDNIIPGVHNMTSQDVLNEVLDVLNRVYTQTEALAAAEALQPETVETFGFDKNEVITFMELPASEAEMQILEQIPDDILASFLGISNFTPEQFTALDNLFTGYSDQIQNDYETNTTTTPGSESNSPETTPTSPTPTSPEERAADAETDTVGSRQSVVGSEQQESALIQSLKEGEAAFDKQMQIRDLAYQKYQDKWGVDLSTVPTGMLSADRKADLERFFKEAEQEIKNNTNFVENKDNGKTNETGLDNGQTMGSESERLPLGAITTSEPVARTIEETTNQAAVGRTDAEAGNKPWSKSEGLKQLADRAKANGTWIEDITPLTDGLGRFAKGTENHVYITKDGQHVIKVNNLLFLNENGTDYPHTRDLKYFFDRISIHNQLFPKDAYDIIGFTNDKDGNTSVVMQQPFVDSEVHPTPGEINADLTKRGFTKTILGEGINKGLEGYTNGKYELTDMKPANVLKMEDGTLRYIDLDLSHVVAVEKPNKTTGMTDDWAKWINSVPRSEVSFPDFKRALTSEWVDEGKTVIEYRYNEIPIGQFKTDINFTGIRKWYNDWVDGKNELPVETQKKIEEVKPEVKPENVSQTLTNMISRDVLRDNVSNSIQNDGQRVLDAYSKKDIETLNNIVLKYAKDQGRLEGGGGAGPKKTPAPKRGASVVFQAAQIAISDISKQKQSESEPTTTEKSTQKWNKNNPPIETWKNEFEKAASQNDVKTINDILSSIKIAKNSLADEHPAQKGLTELLNTIENSDVFKNYEALQAKKQALQDEFLSERGITLQDFNKLNAEQQNSLRSEFNQWVSDNHSEFQKETPKETGKQNNPISLADLANAQVEKNEAKQEEQDQQLSEIPTETVDNKQESALEKPKQKILSLEEYTNKMIAESGVSKDNPEKYDDVITNAENTYSDYVQKLSDSKELQTMYDNANPKEQKKIRQSIEEAGFEPKELINTNPSREKSGKNTPLQRLRDAGQIQFQTVQDTEYFNNKFNEELQQQIDGTLPKGHVYQFGKPGEKLLSSGFDNIPIEITAQKLKEKSIQSDHPFELSEVKDLASAIHNPIAVFDSATQKGSYVILTEMEHNGKNFVVAIEANKKKGSIEINDIRSIHYRKDNVHIANWINDGLLKWADKEKAFEWYSKQRYNSAEVKGTFKRSANILRDFENPTLPSEFNAENHVSKEAIEPSTEKAVADLTAHLLSTGLAKEVRMVTSEEISDLSKGNGDVLRKPDGTIYGFVKNGIVYLNSSKQNLNTPIHEFGHLYTPIIKAEHPEFYAKGVELIKESPYYENVKNDANYSHLDEDGIIDEAMNQAIGDKGAKAVKDLGLFARLKQWIRGVWERIGSKFGIKNLTPDQIENLTLNDWTDIVNSELLNGERLTEKPSEVTDKQQIIGKKGAEALDKAEEATTRLDNLKVAKEMEATKTPQEIRLATGWEKGVDGLWRYEVPDLSQMDLKPIDLSEELVNGKGWFDGTLTLGDLFRETELFKSYPELKDIKLSFGHFDNSKTRGSYDRETKTIYLPAEALKRDVLMHSDESAAKQKELSKEFDLAFKEFDSDKMQQILELMASESEKGKSGFNLDMSKYKETAQTLVHEIQHTIQGIEGFAKGGNPDKMGRYSIEENKKILEQKYSHLPSYKTAKEKGELDKWVIDMVNATGTGITPHEAYKRLAGETEARNASSRMNMSEEERRNTLLSETADVAPEDQIVLMDGMGVSESVPEKPEYQPEKPIHEYANEINDYNERIKAIDERKKALKQEHDEKKINNTEFVSEAKKLNAERFSLDARKKRIEAGTSKPEDFEEVGSRQSAVSGEEKTAVSDGGNKPPITSTAAKLAAEAGDNISDAKRDELDAKIGRGKGKLAFRLQEAYQDQHLAVKHFQDVLKSSGLKITPINDWYMRSTALGGMNDSQLDFYEHRFNLPLMKEVNRMEKISSYRDIENYMMLKHGLERNDWTRKQEAAQLEADGKEVPESLWKKDFSGITAIEEETGKTAQEFIDEFEKKHDTTRFWELINAATTNSLKVGYENGRISKDEYNDLVNRFQYYIPLRGFDKEIAEDRYDYSPNMGTYFVAPLIKAKGRTSRPETPFAYIFSMNHSAITEGNKNNLNQAWLRLARQDKSGLLTLKQAWYKKVGTTDEGLPIWEMQSPEYSSDPEQYNLNIKKFEADMTALAEKGEAMQRRGKLNIGLFVKPKQAAQHEIHVYENGVENVVYINANPKVAQAINGDNRVEAGAFFNGLSTVNRWMAANFTSRNPLFMVTNFERDITFATTTLGVKEGIAYQANFALNVPRAVKAITNVIAGKGAVKDKYDQYAQEFILNGGKTGYTHIVEIKAVQKRIEDEIKKGKVSEHGVVFKAFELGNLVAENTTRLATYITSREAGRGIHESINNAKEVTVNFNRKGSGAMGADAFRKTFLFFNVAVQALSNATKLTKEHPWKMAALLTSFAATGLFAPILAAITGGDEAEEAYNNLSDYDRQNNWCVWTGHGFVKWALPQELRVFHALGDNVYRHIQGKVTNTELAVNTLIGLTDLLPVNPLGAINSEDKKWKMAANAVTPDAIKPLVQLGLNVTYTGGSAYNEFANKYDPGFVQASKNKKGEPFAPAVLVWAAQKADETTGGDGVIPGTVSPNPDIINHLMRGYFGGLYTMGIKMVDTADKVIEGKELKLRDTPVSTLFTSKDDIMENNSAMRKEYKDLKAEVEKVKHYIGKYKQVAEQKYRETGDLGATAEYTSKMQALSTEKYVVLKDLIKEISHLEEQMKDFPEEADNLQKQSNDLKKYSIRINASKDNAEIENIVKEIQDYQTKSQ